MQQTNFNSIRRSQRLSSVFGLTAAPIWIAGPCAVESDEMMDQTVSRLVDCGVRLVRAGAYKPRTSPDSFQGLGRKGLEILGEIRRRYPVRIVSEVVDVRHIDAMCHFVDIFQVGARSMYQYELLKELGRCGRPVLLKNGLAATIEEFLCAAEYITQNGNDRLALCERGIRGYDTYTRNSLDLARVAAIRKETEFPVIVDLSHSLGRKDIALPMARAALAAGADGLMLEVHPDPSHALSDARQQMNFEEFETLMQSL